MKKLLLLLFLFVSTLAHSDEGMWLLNDPPNDLLKQKYDFVLTPEWLEHAQRSVVRFNSGGTGSFISASGLIITNHHVGSDCLAKLSPPGKDYYRDGYIARTSEEELECPDLELNVLVSIEDVTQQVNSAVTSTMSTQQASDARQKKMAEIEQESANQTALRSDVITLNNGGMYHLYRYKKYTDVRIVFSPEVQAAGFGGEIDNFEFPRFNFDIALFRAYENSKKVTSPDFLKLNPQGANENDLVFVIGNPGKTNRLDTIAALKFRRDVHLPYTINRMQYREALFGRFSQLGKKEQHMVGDKQHDAANTLKSAAGQYQGLLDASIMKIKEQQEKELRAAVEENPQLKSETAGAWDRVEKSIEDRKKFWLEYMLIEKGDAFDSALFQIARHLMRMTAELKKPGTERLREYRESNLDSLKQELFSPAPIAPTLERAQLTGSLTFLAQYLGGDHPVVLQILNNRSPETAAAELIAGTKLADPSERKRIADQGWSAIENSDDKMIQLALAIDPYARKLRKMYESEVEEVERQAYGKIEQARFRFSELRYPDGTFTLRFAYGVVKGYPDLQTQIPMATTLSGLFQRAEDHENRPPFALAESWQKNKANLNLNTRLNFVSNADTYGGNSGSPILNRAGEFVGINFDRNRFGLSRNFIYVDEKARQISVHPAAIVEALKKVYKAENILKELGIP